MSFRNANEFNSDKIASITEQSVILTLLHNWERKFGIQKINTEISVLSRSLQSEWKHYIFRRHCTSSAVTQSVWWQRVIKATPTSGAGAVIDTWISSLIDLIDWLILQMILTTTTTSVRWSPPAETHRISRRRILREIYRPPLGCRGFSNKTTGFVSQPNDVSSSFIRHLMRVDMTRIVRCNICL